MGNDGGEDFICPIFTMRAYCESDAPMGVDVEDPPNFEFHPAGFVISWYKYAGRSQKANRKRPQKAKLSRIKNHEVNVQAVRGVAALKRY